MGQTCTDGYRLTHIKFQTIDTFFIFEPLIFHNQPNTVAKDKRSHLLGHGYLHTTYQDTDGINFHFLLIQLC